MFKNTLMSCSCCCCCCCCLTFTWRMKWGILQVWSQSYQFNSWVPTGVTCIHYHLTDGWGRVDADNYLFLSYLISLSPVCSVLWICMSLSRIALLNTVINTYPPPPLQPHSCPGDSNQCCNHGNCSPTILLWQLLFCSFAIYHSSGRLVQL